MNELLSGHNMMGLCTFIFQVAFSALFYAIFSFLVYFCKIPVVARNLHKEYIQNIQLYNSGMSSAALMKNKTEKDLQN